MHFLFWQEPFFDILYWFFWESLKFLSITVFLAGYVCTVLLGPLYFTIMSYCFAVLFFLLLTALVPLYWCCPLFQETGVHLGAFSSCAHVWLCSVWRRHLPDASIWSHYRQRKWVPFQSRLLYNQTFSNSPFAASPPPHTHTPFPVFGLA